MRRPGLLAIGIALAAIAAALLYTTLAREGEYRRLMAEGEKALAADQLFVAIEDFSGAIVLKPGSMAPYLWRGEAYRRRGDLQTALRDLRTASTIDPTAPKPLEALGDVNYALGRFARAAESYDAYLQIDDRSATVLYKLALTRFRLEDPATAARKLSLAVRLNDRFAEAFYLLGVCQSQLDQNTAAVGSLARAIVLAPTTFLPAREEMIRVLLVLKRDTEAISELEELASMEPTKADHLIDAALIYGRLGRTDLAVAELNRAADRDPSQARVYQALGRIWLDAAARGHDGLNKALEALDHAVRMPGATSETFTLHGRALALAGDTAAAQQSFDQALRKTPVDPVAYREIASLARRRGDLADARDSLVRYLALTVDDRDLRTLPEEVADLCLRLDDKAEAVKWLRQAADNGGDDAATLTRIASMQVRAGDRAGASSTVEKGLQTTPSSAALLALRRRLSGSAEPPPSGPPTPVR